MTSFGHKAIAVIRRIPAGRVATYGQVAALAGSPRAAIIVGQILRHQTASAQLPWQRVINREGRISINNIEYPAEAQAELLRAEGVVVKERNGTYFIDLKRFQWNDVGA
jgi:methylated-DNA-protein-cysteine methyltransferase-like protein